MNKKLAWLLFFSLLAGILYAAWRVKELAGSWEEAIRSTVGNVVNTFTALLNPLNILKLFYHVGKFLYTLLTEGIQAARYNFYLAWNQIVAGGFIGGFSTANLDGNFSAQRP